MTNNRRYLENVHTLCRCTEKLSGTCSACKLYDVVALLQELSAGCVVDGRGPIADDRL